MLCLEAVGQQRRLAGTDVVRFAAIADLLLYISPCANATAF